MKTTIQSAFVEFIEQGLIKPLQLSSGVITDTVEARVTVVVRVNGREGVGRASIYLGDLWAWPGPMPERSGKIAAMRALCKRLAGSLADISSGDAAHPLELGMRLHALMEKGTTGDMPLLARAVCASPFDAAIHDAAGHAVGCSAFRFYDEDAPIPSVDRFFASEGAVCGIRECLRSPVHALPAWWLVSANEELEKDVRPMVVPKGIRAFKIKLLARDNREDAVRTAEVFRAAKGWGLNPVLSLDSNEANPDAHSVSDYLGLLEGLDSEAYAAVAYLEQPTSRDILARPQDWSDVGKRKPILLDEGLTSLELLDEVRRQHWSGLALKTCKGHSFALVCAAWTRRNAMLLSLQDLTNPGFSAIHAFLLGSHLKTLNGVELNSPQYTPAANQPWLPTLSGLFEPQCGVHRLDNLNAPGLGSSLVAIL